MFRLCHLCCLKNEIKIDLHNCVISKLKKHKPDSYILRELAADDERCEQEVEAENRLCNCEVAEYLLEENKENAASGGNDQPSTSSNVSTEIEHSLVLTSDRDR